MTSILGTTLSYIPAKLGSFERNIQKTCQYTHLCFLLSGDTGCRLVFQLLEEALCEICGEEETTEEDAENGNRERNLIRGISFLPECTPGGQGKDSF
jgi:hypothetical protein